MSDTSTTATGTAAGEEPGRSRTETLMRDLRRMPLYRQLVPMEAGVGWPIPLRRPGLDGEPVVYLKLPLYGFRPSPRRGQGALLFPPFATVTLRWDTGRPVEYVDLLFTRPWAMSREVKPVGEFPHDAVRGSRQAYLADRARLLASYDELCERLARREPLSADWASEFSDLLRRLVEPGLEPYFRTLGRSFYERFLGAGPDAAGEDGG